MSTGLEIIFSRVKRAQRRGDMEEARHLLEEVLSRYPNNRKAADALGQLVPTAPQDDSAALQAGVAAASAAHKRGDFAAMLRVMQDLLARFPKVMALHGLLGAAYLGLGDAAEAEQAFRAALAGQPDDAINRTNLGVALRKQERFAEAERCYREAIALKPDHGEAHYNLGNLLIALGRQDEAMGSLHAALAIKPDHVDALYSLGNVHRERKAHGAAIDCYEQLLAIRPDHGDARINMGSVQLDSGEKGAAIAAFRSAANAEPSNFKAYANLGQCLSLVGALDEAHAAFARALAIRPGDVHLRAQLLYMEAHLCDWSRRNDFAALPILPVVGSDPVPPFIALPFDDDPARQLARSRQAMEGTALPARASIAPRRRPDGKIRIGYLSADFHEHATLHLLSGLLREHDRKRFEVYAYSFGADEGAEARERTIAHLDGFFDIRSLTDAKAVDLVRGHDLDIAIDLKGHTRDARPALFAAGMAPVQIGYLGYPGSIGADFLDYIIADHMVIPDGGDRHFSEKVIRLPTCYQPNDDQRAIGDYPGDRAAMGLPEEGFIFCSFNQNWKIDPTVFTIWMRLLAQVDDSILWLIRSNPWAEENLRKEAQARGIDPARLVFADKLAHADHLARHRHADLFLDTFIVNAHTTASDALWAGLPVLTMPGRQFAARVAASLLTAIDLPELIAASEDDYARIALNLARSPEKLAEIKARLMANRTSTPLFDTRAYARKIEAAYEQAHQRSLDGLAPTSFAID